MKLFIHIGFLKTGSTYLQKNVFSEIKNTKYIHFNEKKYLLDEINHIQTAGDIFLSKKKISKIKNFINKNKDKNILISSETFSGAINTPTIGTTIVMPIIAKRIKKIFKNPQIIIFLRNQKDMIISSYKDDVALGYSLSFEEWLNNKVKLNSLDYYFFHKIIKFYFKLFGRKNVHIFFYEDIFFKKNGFKSFFQLIGLKEKKQNFYFHKYRENQSQSDFTIFISKFLNRFIRTKLNTLSSDGINKNLKIYNFWRYRLSKITNKINSSIYNFSNSKKLIALLKDIKKDNFQLNKLLKNKLPKSFFNF